MTRKFTPPTTFPAQYNITNGKATVVAPMPDGLGYVGFITLFTGTECGSIWTADGECVDGGDSLDLHDIPQLRVLYRQYGIAGQHVITCLPDGTEPKVTWEPSE